MLIRILNIINKNIINTVDTIKNIRYHKYIKNNKKNYRIKENMITSNICYYPPQSYNEYIKNTRGCMMYNGVYIEDNTIKKGKEKNQL